MPYYVVNAGRGRSTHIMKSKSPSIPGVEDCNGTGTRVKPFGRFGMFARPR
jgi:hypothetical protein